MARKGRQRALAFGSEKAFGVEGRLELLERGPQRAFASGFNVVDDDLEVAPRLVDGKPSAQHHRQAVGWREADEAVAAGEHDAAQLRPVVLQAEVPVARSIGAEVGHLAANPDQPKALFDQKPRRGSHLTDGADAILAERRALALRRQTALFPSFAQGVAIRSR